MKKINNMRSGTFITIIILVLLIVSGYYFWPNKTKIDIVPNDKSNSILVSSPVGDAEVSSPLSISGRARGNWFFEGSMPIVIQDAYGSVIAEGHVTAQGAWTTTEFVKFVGNLQFNNYIKGSKATLIIKKSNPSGLPQNYDSVRIPIILK